VCDAGKPIACLGDAGKISATTTIDLSLIVYTTIVLRSIYSSSELVATIPLPVIGCRACFQEIDKNVSDLPLDRCKLSALNRKKEGLIGFS